jgi:hypothetical protein
LKNIFTNSFFIIPKNNSLPFSIKITLKKKQLFATSLKTVFGLVLLTFEHPSNILQVEKKKNEA